jgi:hypothetical protein
MTVDMLNNHPENKGRRFHWCQWEQPLGVV